MTKKLIFTEIILITVEPERAFRVADECLVDIRMVEHRKEKAAWVYEYEVKGEFGNVEKFLIRIKRVETVQAN